MRVLSASLVVNPLPEHIKVTVFMDGLKVGPSRTQLFRCGKATMRRQAQCKELQELELAPGRYPWNWVRPYRAPSVATDVGSSGTCNGPALREGKGSFLPNLGARGSADGARHGGLAPESLGAIETRNSSGGLLVVYAGVRYTEPDGTDQAGNIGPQGAEAAEESNASGSGVGKRVARKVDETKRKNESCACVSSVGNVVPRGVK
ncbi:Gag protein [Phytophthora palmivora]|uniref:Gag protein n=1 Tax=Phytophthora palmivora TaxID=4796 RepID=A0A2P4XXI3_9STRA|nr:Gag protein [Phytophthora palmivora]